MTQEMPVEEVITNHKNKLIDSCKLSTLYDQYYLFVKQKYEVTFSMLEIYNEQVRDLLTKDNPKGGLQVLITGHNCYLRVTREGVKSYVSACSHEFTGLGTTRFHDYAVVFKV